MNLESRVQYLLRLSRTLRDIGFEVFIVCDGQNRHHSKRSALFRKSKIHKQRFDLKLLKTKLLDVSKDEHEGNELLMK